ncbi:APC family permease [Alteromonas sp. ALT199]|uniref:APC family permease n=1 Tax=unclassified Alteromonas TaxID=2614992 RepID=UPI001BEB4A6D|nr:APC family permease [Alteromonas sp. ALT199]MBT3134713.1 APC family permease [Alteromonas sp. ALT199]
MSSENKSLLTKGIGGIGAALLVLNGLIGAGIFALPAKMAAALGAFSPYIFLIFGALMLAIVWCFGQLAVRYQETGGPVIYAQKGFGNAAAFQTGFVYYLARATAIAANMHVLLLYAGYMWPELNTGAGKSFAIIGLTTALIVVNIVGLKAAMRSLDTISVLKLVPFVALIVIGYWQVDFSTVSSATTIPAFDTISAGALLTLYAFIGFETVVVTSGETNSPKKTIPRALMLTVSGIAIFYFCVQWLYWHTVGPAKPDSAPLIALANKIFGETGALVMTLTAVVSVAGNLLANVISTSRLTFSMARQSLIPGKLGEILGKVHSKFATPSSSILVLGLFAGAMALTGSFVWLAISSVLARLAVYAMCVVVLIKAQKAFSHGSSSQVGSSQSSLLFNEHGRNSDLTTSSSANAINPFKRLIPFAALVVCAWSIAQSSTNAWLFLLGELAVGALLYFALFHLALSNKKSKG